MFDIGLDKLVVEKCWEMKSLRDGLLRNHERCICGRYRLLACRLAIHDTAHPPKVKTLSYNKCWYSFLTFSKGCICVPSLSQVNMSSSIIQTKCNVMGTPGKDPTYV